VKAANAVDYSNYKAEGVERHANHKANSGVRARRIKTILKDLRDHQRTINHGHIILKLWTKIKGEENREQLEKLVEHYSGSNIATGSATGDWNSWSKLRDKEITHDELIESALAYGDRMVNGEYQHRWIAHILNRLGYERSELGETTRFAGTITKAILQTFAREQGAHKPEAKLIDGDWELGSSVALPAHIADNTYITMDNEGWLDLMQGSGYTVPAPKVRKPSSKVNVPLINPTLAEAQRLQQMWNDQNLEYCTKKGYRAKTAEVREASQARVSANSKGDYAHFKTYELDKDGNHVSYKYERCERIASSTPVCRIRIFVGGHEFYKADVVTHLIDKPGKPLPINWPESKEKAA